MKIVPFAVQLTLLLAAFSLTANAQPVRFAVAPCVFTGDASAAEWLPAGIAFDLEKRLERWPGLENSDRLHVRRTLKDMDLSDGKTVARALIDRLGLDFAITLTGDCSNSRVEFDTRVWMKSSLDARKSNVEGQLDGLFGLQDKLVECMARELRDAFPNLAAPEKMDSLRIAPAKSVKAFEQVIRGMIALQSGDNKTARSRLDKAHELEPELWWAHYFLGALEFHEGNFDKAIERCRAAIALDPNLYAGVYANLAYCYQGKADKERFQWAKDEFERRAGKGLPQRVLPVGHVGGGHN